MRLRWPAVLLTLSWILPTAAYPRDASTTTTTTLPRPGWPTLPPLSRHNPDKNKYFHEVDSPDGEHHTDLSHHDARFFHGPLSEEQRKESLEHMVRAYLINFQKLGLETWIAHGTLLGWWWNAKVLPWDWDLDTQVLESTLIRMGDLYNRTTYPYQSDDGTFQREYLLDVNPWSQLRAHGDGANVIDARWVDTSNGLYIDITGLSELHADSRPGVISCKNHHDYALSDIFPLRETIFEGMTALVPYSYAPILAEEYTAGALVRTKHFGHEFRSDVLEWVRDSPEEPSEPQQR